MACSGNTERVAQIHHLRVTEGHSAQASAEPANRAAQNPAQYPAVSGFCAAEHGNVGKRQSPGFTGAYQSFCMLTE